MQEPRIKATILVPDDYLGDVLKLCQDRRGIQLDLSYAGSRAMVVYDLPLNEVVFDFYDRLKSITKGYASFDYEITGYREDNLVKMQVLVNDEPVDALSMMVHRDRAEGRGRLMWRKAERADPPATCSKSRSRRAIGGKVIARENFGGVAQGRDGRNATAATSRASGSCWTSRKRVRRRCASSGRWRSRSRRLLAR